HEHVEVVDHQVAVGQDGAGDPGLSLVAAQAPDQVLVLAAAHVVGLSVRLVQLASSQPAVDVVVEQVGALGGQPAQVSDRDVEPAGESVDADLGGAVGAVGHRGAVVVDDRVGAGDDEVAVQGGQGGGGGHDVNAAGVLVTQHGDHVVEAGVSQGVVFHGGLLGSVVAGQVLGVQVGGDEQEVSVWCAAAGGYSAAQCGLDPPVGVGVGEVGFGVVSVDDHG